MHPRWKARASDLEWRQWDDDESLVFHAPSGDTHLLNRVSALALRQLEDQPMSAMELAESVARALQCEVEAGFESRIELMLNRLDELGLIERAS